MEPDVIQRFLESVGQKADIDLYLKLFRSERKESFAILVAEAGVVKNALDPLHFDLRILAGLGLIPIVILGLFDATDADTNSKRVKDWLEEDLVPAEILSVQANMSDDDLAAIRAAINKGSIPLVSMQTSQSLHVDHRFNLLQRLSNTVESHKVVYLSTHSGLGRRNAPHISVINLATDYDILMKEDTLSRRDQLVLRRTRQLLEQAPHRMTASVVNPLSLLRELFTINGAGTLIRKGSTVQSFASLAEIDQPRLRTLIESAFNRRLLPGVLERTYERAFIESGYRGAALLEQSPAGIYLSKFVVDRMAQGEGIGGDVWKVMTREYPSFFWRSRPDNPIVPWYIRNCSGMVRIDSWHIFWRNLTPEQIAPAIAYAEQRPRDLEG
jgi:bifunctional N-acetylglutamate synthase/kinase